ncbi:MAG: nuclear transport factor 2 family protein, partial [Kofleriaceae bacterium]|nr:nuclear transport factor 2 family protein [Kofleriaceae bacterium]
MAPHTVIANYYAAFNAGDFAAMTAMVTDDFVHDPNQGKRRVGKALFTEFLADMNRCYREQVVDLVVMVNGPRAAAEFVINGSYLVAQDGLPAAHGQAYRLPVGAFFELRDGKIARVTNYYN